MKQRQVSAGIVTEVVVWLLDDPVPGCTHRCKYRLYAGHVGGNCIVRYDNERGKGDHRHQNEKEEPYLFHGIVELLDDFKKDLMRLAP